VEFSRSYFVHPVNFHVNQKEPFENNKSIVLLQAIPLALFGFVTVAEEIPRVRFPMGSLEFFIDIILPASLWPWGRISQ